MLREKCHNWASQMAQWVKALPELTWKVKLNGTGHMKVAGEYWLFKVVLQTLYMGILHTHHEHTVIIIQNLVVCYMGTRLRKSAVILCDKIICEFM